MHHRIMSLAHMFAELNEEIVRRVDRGIQHDSYSQAADHIFDEKKLPLPHADRHSLKTHLWNMFVKGAFKKETA